MKRTTAMRMGLAAMLMAIVATGCGPKPTHPSVAVDVELAEIESKQHAAQVERDRRTQRCMMLPDTVVGGSESMRGQCLREVLAWYSSRMEELQKARLDVFSRRFNIDDGQNATDAGQTR